MTGETMNFARDPTTTEYFVTAYQIFECCGVESTSSLCVDALMDKLAPFVKTNKAEFSYLKTLLDPEQCNPEINVSHLANALHQYSESPKSKMDLDESFNFKNGQAPQDSDSGISTDGLQLLEELQSELKEKDHLTHQLRTQLDFTDRQHEETIATLTAERDSLRTHLNMLREENATLSDVRRDYDDACERLCSSGAALDAATRELDVMKRRAKLSRDQLASLEADKLSLQELLSKSKDECHRINEMYATRQSALLEENETLRSQHADLASRLQDQEEFMQQVVKEKVLLEMELKDMMNRSNQTHMRLDRSIDISYTEDQMLTALDSLNADSRFSTGNCIMDDDSFMNALKEDQGRSTNMSLFDEIRMSFNISRLNITEFNAAHCEKCSLDNSLVAIATQTDEIETYSDKDESLIKVDETQTDVGITRPRFEGNNLTVSTATQFDTGDIKSYDDCDIDESLIKTCANTQTDENVVSKVTEKGVDFEMQTDFAVNENNSNKTDLGIQTDVAENDFLCGGDNNQNHKNCINLAHSNENNAQYKDYVKVILKVDMEIQTEASMLNEHCLSENNIPYLDAKDYTTIATQTVGKFIRKPPTILRKAQKLFKLKKKLENYQTATTQTDEIKPCINNNNAYFVKSLESDHSNRVEGDMIYANIVMKEMEEKIKEYEDNLTYLETLISQGKDKNEKLQSLVDDLLSKIEVLEAACETQRDIINKIASTETRCVKSQTEFDQTSVSTQADVPCLDCDKRKAIAPHRGLRKFFWEPLKCLFQLFAIICFLVAVSVLYGVSQRGRARCERERGVTPWSWFDAQDVMDLLLRIEYTAEVPM